MESGEPLPTAYQILGIHPTAPPELVNYCYWVLTKELQDRRRSDPEADSALHHVTVAYQQISEQANREAYNERIGFHDEPLITRRLPRKRRTFLGLWPGGRGNAWTADRYEVLGLTAGSPPAFFDEAYQLMQVQYLRLPPGSRRRRVLLQMLEDSYQSVRTDVPREQAAPHHVEEPEPVAYTVFPESVRAEPPRRAEQPANDSPPGALPLPANAVNRRSPVLCAARGLGRGVLAGAKSLAKAIAWLLLSSLRAVVAGARAVRRAMKARRERRAATAAYEAAADSREPSGKTVEAPLESRSAEEVFLGRLSLRAGEGGQAGADGEAGARR